MSDQTMILPKETAQAFEEKYGMSFEAYRHIWETEDRPEHYSYEAEEDYLTWEGLVTRHERIFSKYIWVCSK